MLNDTEVFNEVFQEDILKLLKEFLPVTVGLSRDEQTFLANEIYQIAGSDLDEYVENDPAAKSRENVYKTYKAFDAIKFYRIANAIYYCDFIENETLRRQYARGISELAKSQTKIEIHPAAKIGRRFVIDHGVGTVIGETCEIGDNCYLLQGVILGAEKIKGNPLGKRHPTLGKNVQLGGHSRVFGKVEIKDNTFIGPYCVITNDVPDDFDVTIINQLQLRRKRETKNSEEEVVKPSKKRANESLNNNKTEIYGITPGEDNLLIIHGLNIPKDISVFIANERLEPIQGVSVKIVENSENNLQFKISIDKHPLDRKFYKRLKNLNLVLRSVDFEIIITRAVGINRVITDLLTSFK